MSEQGPTVVVVEDDPQLRRFLRAALGAHGYRLLEAGTLSEGRLLIASHAPDLVLLDLGLPDGDGLELTRELREYTTVPILVISARGQERDKVAALDAGADDHLTKPFGVLELLARMRVALRHARQARGAEDSPLITVGPLAVDRARREVRRAGELLHLTPTEYRLLVLFAEHRGRVLTHRQILSAVWGPHASATQAHVVRVHMAELRKKVEPEPARPRWLVTEPGVGYRLRDEPPPED